MNKIEEFKKYYKEVFNDTCNKFNMNDINKEELLKIVIKEAVCDFTLILDNRRNAKYHYDFYSRIVNHRISRGREIQPRIWIQYTFWNKYIKNEEENEKRL